MTERECENFVKRLKEAIEDLNEAIGNIQRYFDPDMADLIVINQLISRAIYKAGCVLDENRDTVKRMINDRKAT